MLTITTAQAARIAGVPEPRLRKWISRGLLDRQPDGGLIYTDVCRVAGQLVSKRERHRRRAEWDRICATEIRATTRPDPLP